MNIIQSNIKTMTSENIIRNDIPNNLSDYIELIDHAPHWKVDRPNGVKAGDIVGGKPNNQYLRVSINGTRYKLHRIIFYLYHGYVPDHIDHIDGNTLNNSIDNLRPATHQQNMMNLKVSRLNKTGVKGVTFESKNNSWKVRISKNGKRHYIGNYRCFIDACSARFRAEKAMHGDFRRKLIHELMEG